MKKITLLLALFFVGMISAQNESSGTIATTISTPSPLSGETFRFGPGLVTQLDGGSAFDFNASQWFSIGRLNTGSQQVYGLRFQLKNRAFTAGYQDTNDINPRIQWIGDSFAEKTDLEFRVANSFTSTNSTLVATMTHQGKTFFGKPLTFASSSEGTKVGINYTDVPEYNRIGLTLENTSSSGGRTTGIRSINNAGGYVMTGVDVESNGSSYGNTGVNVRVSKGYYSTGVGAYVTGTDNGTTYGVRGSIYNEGNPTGFGAGIYGSAASTAANRYAGYFNGNVFVTGTFTVSDKKLKENIEDEVNMLDKIAELDAVTYTFKENDQLNLPQGLQHGFLAQNLEEVFPELVTTINKPIFDKENKQTGTYDYKAVNYIGMISVLTSSLKEMNEQVTSLKTELEELKRESLAKKENDIKEIGFSMDQNRPNPFTSQTTINYTIPNNAKATISVFDMSGKFVRDYNLTSEKGQVVISSNDIGKGMFIYSLVSNGEIMVSKKMIVK